MRGVREKRGTSEEGEGPDKPAVEPGLQRLSSPPRAPPSGNTGGGLDKKRASHLLAHLLQGFLNTLAGSWPSPPLL